MPPQLSVRPGGAPLAQPVELQDPDLRLVARAVAGDVAAFGDLYDRHLQAILRFARARLGDPEEARDVVQETFLEALRGLHRYRGRGSFQSWLTTIAYRRICARYRVRSVASAAQAEFPADAAPESWSIEERLDARRALERCEARLADEMSAVQQRIFRLRYGENRSIPFIARAVQRSHVAVKVGLFRTRRKLRSGAPDLADGPVG